MKGDLIFIFTGNIPVRSAKACVMANLPTLNAIMQSTDTSYDHFREPSKWAYVGVMRNSSTAANTHSRQSNYNGRNRFSAESILNVDVRGATRMFNYWTTAKAGDHLWLWWVCKNYPNTERKYWQLLPFDVNPVSKRHADQFLQSNYAIDTKKGTVSKYQPICVGWVLLGIGNGEKTCDKMAIDRALNGKIMQGSDSARFKLPMVHAFVHI